MKREEAIKIARDVGLDKMPPTGRTLEAFANEVARIAVAAERERCKLAVHGAVMRALDEASVRHEVLRGMCFEVGLEAFDDALKTPNV